MSSCPVPYSVPPRWGRERGLTLASTRNSPLPHRRGSKRFVLLREKSRIEWQWYFPDALTARRGHVFLDTACSRKALGIAPGAGSSLSALFAIFKELGCTELFQLL
jgi:hypothetical protein